MKFSIDPARLARFERAADAASEIARQAGADQFDASANLTAKRNRLAALRADRTKRHGADAALEKEVEAAEAVFAAAKKRYLDLCETSQHERAVFATVEDYARPRRRDLIDRL